MNDKLNLFSKKQDPKMRVIFVVVAILIIVSALGWFWHHRSHESAMQQASADLAEAPGIASLPGAGNPSNQYVQAQNLQNQQQAVAARKNATSDVPTITRPNFVGNPDAFGVLPSLPSTDSTASSVECPIKKVVVMYKPNPASCSLDNLRLAKQAGVTAEELVCQGCSCPILKAAGYTIGDLKSVGLSATQLHNCGFDVNQLVAAGFSANDLKAAGFDAKALADAGFTAAQLKDAGFGAQELKNAGFDAKELQAAGFAAKDLVAAGFSADALKAAGVADNNNCDVESLKKAHDAGISATELKNKGCDIAALKAAGFSAGELKAAGFTASQLKAAGYNADALKNAGFDAKELQAAGFAAKDLKAAGFSADELKAAGFNAGQLKAAGFSADDLKKAGFNAQALHDAGYSAAELKNAGFSPDELKTAGFSKGDLLRAGFTPVEAGYASVPASGSASNAQSNNLPPLAQRPNYMPNTMGAGASMPSIKTPEGQLARLAAITQRQIAAQQQTDMVQEVQGNMTMQSQKMLAGWSNSPSQVLDVAPVVVVAANNGNGAGNGAENAGPTVKAGTVVFAVLDTSINSDENSPIMARIVTGELKGAKLLGQFSRVDKRVLITFNLVNLPQFDRSLTINAVAIDPDTARTALAGEVNNHYLLRYGTLFASAFLQGLSSAVLTSGTTVFPTAFGPGYIHPELSAGQSTLVGLGTVGQQYASRMSNNFDRPPTIKVAGGTGIGILLMNDLALPGEINNH